MNLRVYSYYICGSRKCLEKGLKERKLMDFINLFAAIQTYFALPIPNICSHFVQTQNTTKAGARLR